jgi:hypothetical protein
MDPEAEGHELLQQESQGVQRTKEKDGRADELIAQL